MEVYGAINVLVLDRLLCFFLFSKQVYIVCPTHIISIVNSSMCVIFFKSKVKFLRILL